MRSPAAWLRNVLTLTCWGASLPACGERVDTVSTTSRSDEADRSAASAPRGMASSSRELSVLGDEAEDDMAPVVGAPRPLSPVAGEPALGAWVFDEEQLRTYELDVDPAVWAELERNARAEEYVRADLRVEGRQLPGIGVRFKGSWGTLTGCFDESGARTCSKLSIKLDVSEYEPEQRIDGLKRLNFHSMIEDPSHMHERLGYWMFREMGLPAPRATHARLTLNGEYLGVFSLVEDVDGRFTSTRFAGGDGNLYKELWPPAAASSEQLTAALKTNEDVRDHSGVTLFQAELLSSAGTELATAVARHMDVDALLAHLAVDRAINNWDGVTAFYCYEEPCLNHNFFLYQHEGEPRFTLIPWDLDKTFWLFVPFSDPPALFDIPEDCSARYHDGPPMMPPGCDPILQGLAQGDRGRYSSQIDRLLEGPFRLELMQDLLDRWQRQIEDAVERDPNGPGMEAFRAALDELHAALPELRDRLVTEREANL